MTVDFSVQEQHRWRRAPGVELLGAVTGSGLVEETHLVQRTDGQVIQISTLLNLILQTVEPGSAPEALAREVSRRYGKELDAAGLAFLIDKKLEPLGLIEDAAAVAAMQVPAPTAQPFFALRLKGTILPERAVNRLAGMLRPIYFPPVVVLALVALVALDIVLFVSSSIMEALAQIWVTPTLLLGLFAMMVVGAVIHELGHATACSYGGARPGVIGFGVYLVFPAFFTNVTDSYRLDRNGKLRTDLGGLYFNTWCVLAAGAGHLLTGSGILLLFVIATQITMLQQLPPTIRLDGYFVLADLVGVPDLFSRVGPVLRSLIPGRPVDPRVTELRPAARRIVKIWVLTVVPALALILAWMLWNLPAILTQASAAVVVHAHALSAAWMAVRPVEVVLSALSIVLLVLPIAGIAVIVPRLVLDGAKGWRRFRASGAATRSIGALATAGPPRSAATHLHAVPQGRAGTNGPMSHVRMRRPWFVRGLQHHLAHKP